MNETSLFYTSPATAWTEAMPLGNGILGMMVFGGTGEETVQLNEETMWSGYPFDADNPEMQTHLGEMRSLIFAGKYAEAQALCEKYLICRGAGSQAPDAAYGSFQTAGELKISQNIDNADGYSRTLDLRDGVATVKFSGVERTYFASYDYNVTAVHIKGHTDGMKVAFVREASDIIYSGNDIIISGRLPQRFCTVVRFIRMTESDEAVIYTSTATEYGNGRDPYESAMSNIKRACAAGFMEIQKKHLEYFREKIDRVKFELCSDDSKAGVTTDERIKNPEGDLGLVQLYFMFGRYLLISSSRGSLPANLQGLWSDKYREIWSADYHININIQMNYWPADVCGLSEFSEPYHRYIASLVAPGTHTARVAYGCGGWVAHTITNPWGFTSPGEHPSWGSFMCAGAWCCCDLWEHYLFTCDLDFLRRYYPVMRASAEFFRDFLVLDPNTGYMVTCPSNSPENSYINPADGKAVAICAGPTMDNSILRYLFDAVVKSAILLHEEDSFTDELSALAKKLPPLKIGKYGQIMEWQSDFDEKEPGHRHMSNLFGLHPSNLITKSKTPELFYAARASIDRRLANGGGHTGWSRAWVINFLARLRDGGAAYENLKALLSHSTQPNMFDTHPPFQIDGNFGGTAGIAEMLLQSHEGFINILPALPEKWSCGSFSGLMARGGYKVSASWKDGKVEFCSVERVTGDKTKPVDVFFNGEMHRITPYFEYRS